MPLLCDWYCVIEQATRHRKSSYTHTRIIAVLTRLPTGQHKTNKDLDPGGPWTLRATSPINHDRRWRKCYSGPPMMPLCQRCHVKSSGYILLIKLTSYFRVVNVFMVVQGTCCGGGAISHRRYGGHAGFRHSKLNSWMSWPPDVLRMIIQKAWF